MSKQGYWNCIHADVNIGPDHNQWRCNGLTTTLYPNGDNSMCENCYNWERKTNYDHYFGTPAKAAKYISETDQCYRCPLMSDCEALDSNDCQPIMEKWLKQEYKGCEHA